MIGFTSTLLAGTPVLVTNDDGGTAIICGDIGPGQREYELEPLTAPSVPEPVVAPAPEHEPVPAGVAA